MILSRGGSNVSPLAFAIYRDVPNNIRPESSLVVRASTYHNRVALCVWATVSCHPGPQLHRLTQHEPGAANLAENHQSSVESRTLLPSLSRMCRTRAVPFLPFRGLLFLIDLPSTDVLEGAVSQ